jgi:hypothetical protein
LSKFYEGQRVRRVDGSDQPEMTRGNIYVVTSVDVMEQFITVAGCGDKKWNTAAFDPTPPAVDTAPPEADDE